MRGREIPFTLVEGFVVVIVVAVLLSLVGPLHPPVTKEARLQACDNNLSQLWKMMGVYQLPTANSYPHELGGDFWLKLGSTNPPLIDPSMTDLYFCPLLGESTGRGCTDYLGPLSDANDLPAGAFIGGDKPGNHDKYSKGSGNVLRKSGDVMELQGTEYDDFIKACRP